MRNDALSAISNTAWRAGSSAIVAMAALLCTWMLACSAEPGESDDATAADAAQDAVASDPDADTPLVADTSDADNSDTDNSDTDADDEPDTDPADAVDDRTEADVEPDGEDSDQSGDLPSEDIVPNDASDSDGLDLSGDIDPLSVVCLPCTNDDPCGAGGQCTELGDGRFCGLDCEASPDICGEHYACVEVLGDGEDAGTEAWLCLPALGFCEECPEGYRENDGEGPPCVDILECASNNGECGVALYWTCVENAGAPPTCLDVKECEVDNGDCGDPLYWSCAEAIGGPPSCTDIDECDTDNGGCDQLCDNSDDGFACDCNDGYTLNEDGTTCDDIDECDTDNGGCEQECDNTEGSFTCDCSSFYTLNEDGTSCDDVDECDTNNGGCGLDLCVNQTGGPPECDDVDECLTDNGDCGDPARWLCTNHVQVAPTCTDIDECDTNNGGCQHLCDNAEGSFACDCNEGYALNPDGATCGDIDECDTGNGGCAQLCDNSDGGFTCDCNGGYTLNADGLACDDINECATNNGGCGLDLCVNQPGGPPGCDDVDECLTNNGGCGDPAHWLCTNHARVAPTCSDIDECATGNGGCEQVCEDADGSFACDCNGGYTLNLNGSTCDDINECATLNGGCAQVCNNSTGSFECDCQEGYALNVDGSTCDDIDECQTDNGGCDQICENEPEGEFTCDCNAGYALDADGFTCNDVDECATSNGGCGAASQFLCTNRIGDTPICQPIALCYRGLLSCQDFNECTNDTCHITAGCQYTDVIGACDDGSACTQSDACFEGECVGSDPIACPSTGSCYGEGICDPNSGECVRQALPDGTACNDTDHCTITGACQNGVCTGLHPLVCAPDPDQCHVSYCPPDLGTCVVEEVPNDTPCDDGNACTQASSCQAGECTGEEPVVCEALDECHLAGVCNPDTGVCSNPAGNEGDDCDDGDLCTGTSTCDGGQCVGSDEVVCEAPPDDLCLLPGTCDPGTGECGDPVPVTCAPECSIGSVPGTCDPATGFCSNARTSLSLCIADSCHYGLCDHGRCGEPIPIVCNGACQPNWNCEPVSDPEWGIDDREPPPNGDPILPLMGGGGYWYPEASGFLFTRAGFLFFGGDYSHAVNAGQCDPAALDPFQGSDPDWCGHQQGFDVRADGRLNDFVIGGNTLTAGNQGAWLTDRYVGFHQEVFDITIRFPVVRDFTTVTIGFLHDACDSRTPGYPSSGTCLATSAWQAYSSLSGSSQIYPGQPGRFYEPIELEAFVSTGDSTPRTVRVCNTAASPGFCTNDFVPTSPAGSTTVSVHTRGEVTFRLEPDNVQTLQAGGDTLTLRIHNPWRSPGTTPSFTAIDEITIGDPAPGSFAQCSGGRECVGGFCTPRGDGRDGVACNDANACTSVDICESGTCVGSEPLVCNAAPGQCQLPQSCNASGGCYFPNRPNGTTCNDGNACTLGDSCQGGSCVSGTPATCPPSGSCYGPGVCRTDTGACDYAPLPDGTACNDGDDCGLYDACSGGICDAEPIVCGCTAGVDCEEDGYAYDVETDCDGLCFADLEHGDFRDFAPGALDDGILGSDNVYDDCIDPDCQGIWAGFEPGQGVGITFHFPTYRVFDLFRLGVSNRQTGTVFAQPPEVRIAFSTDGVAFGEPLVFRLSDGSMPALPVGGRGDVWLDLEESAGRFVRVAIPGHARWTLLDEVGFGEPCFAGGVCRQTTLCDFEPLLDGASCGFGEDQCVAGECSNCAFEGMTACDGECFDLENDPEHCGSCENACFPGDSCHNGVCSDCSQQIETLCGDFGCFDYPATDCGDGICIAASSFPTNTDHCGFTGGGQANCGNACDEGDICEGGLTCSSCHETGLNVTETFWGDPVDGAELTYCLGTDGNPRCVELDTGRYTLEGFPTLFDGRGAFGCGTCGNVCPPGQDCLNGVCGTCGGGDHHVCNGVCTSIYDPLHCGADFQAGSCSNVCTAGNRCHGIFGCATCANPAEGILDCNSPTEAGLSCVDTNTNMAHCGGCGQLCDGVACQGGRCLECFTDADCTNGWCDATNQCQPLQNFFEVCSRDSQCSPGYVYDSGATRRRGLCITNHNDGDRGGCCPLWYCGSPDNGGCNQWPECPWQSPAGVFEDGLGYCAECTTSGSNTNPCPLGEICNDRVPIPLLESYTPHDPQPSDPTIWRNMCVRWKEGDSTDVCSPDPYYCTSHVECASGTCDTPNGLPPSGSNLGTCVNCATFPSGSGSSCCRAWNESFATGDARCSAVAPNLVCNAGRCREVRANGGVCDHDAACLSGVCNIGNNSCVECTLPEHCEGIGDVPFCFFNRCVE